MLNIGICDDFPIFCELIEAIIRQYGEKNNVIFSIRRFGSGEELIDTLNRENVSFDLLFLDYYMKKLNGLETAKRIRQMETAKAKPSCNIVFVTSMDNPYKLMSARPLRIIGKPVSPVIIDDIIDHVLSEKCKALVAVPQAHD
ncbi:MAG TPA: response regulator [Thermoclostridium caenicola]|uniref:response regulator n=1 Tax=Thermoclostridium caenicola TaxID=659425 RepID=UPI002C8EF270|nr:response regulator [Thermoclostridium caenicola]HOK42703.1 response regulator [Thermoclostridium caenicola]HOL84414.1 response regulator [Thermoclostridium caenicola]HPO75944.1 response regulator [Thermoclostridium caenicola]